MELMLGLNLLVPKVTETGCIESDFKDLSLQRNTDITWN